MRSIKILNYAGTHKRFEFYEKVRSGLISDKDIEINITFGEKINGQETYDIEFKALTELAWNRITNAIN